jgi:periplasmic protein TonB
VQINKQTREQYIKTVGSTEQDIARVGGSISPPRVRYDPDPEYTAAARMARYQGTTILWIVVDSNGQPKDVRIERALGMGLDDEAVKSVEKWRFDPAMKEGSPVAVQINVEINFRLY